jgi:hypothetical protein
MSLAGMTAEFICKTNSCHLEITGGLVFPAYTFAHPPILQTRGDLQ